MQAQSHQVIHNATNNDNYNHTEFATNSAMFNVDIPHDDDASFVNGINNDNGDHHSSDLLTNVAEDVNNYSTHHYNSDNVGEFCLFYLSYKQYVCAFVLC